MSYCEQPVHAWADRCGMWIANRLLERLGNLVAPPRCAVCDERLERGRLFCDECRSTLAPAPVGMPIAVSSFEGAVARALRRLKYGERPDLAAPLGALLRDAVVKQRAALGQIDLVVPVPVPRSRLIERGFNQAALLARHVADGLGAKFAPLALRRAEGTQKQAALGRVDRLRNLQGAFSVRREQEVRGARILLVDDVCTTGTTLSCCSQVLLLAGADEVHAAVVARVPAHHRSS